MYYNVSTTSRTRVANSTRIKEYRCTGVTLLIDNFRYNNPNYIVNKASTNNVPNNKILTFLN